MSELFEELTDEDIAETAIPRLPSGHPAPVQNGPIRHKDKITRCASRGCGSPTWTTFQGIPYCLAHVLKYANELFIKMGVEQ